MIKFEGVTKHYEKQIILNNLSFEIEEGSFTVLIGPSGCGKTTTLKTINRLIDIDSGHIYVGGKDIAKEDKVKLRRSIGYVIQQIGLFPNMTIEENICVVPKLLKYDKERSKTIAKEMLELVDMPYEDYAHKYPSQLSGGQQQRIGVLRALAASPPIVLMDEPFSALDPMTRQTLQEEVRKLKDKLNKTIVFVTHDMDEALKMADTIIFMEKGKIVQKAKPDEMIKNPANDLIRSFMGKRSLESQQIPQTAADIMRKKVVVVPMTKGVRESVDLMSRNNIDTLVVVDSENTYQGIVSINSIKKSGTGLASIESLIEKNHPFSYVDEDAQISFEKLMDSTASYIVVLEKNNRVAGIITKTSLAKAMAEAVWGDNE